MASRIAGITIKIGGDTDELQNALKGVDKTLKTTQANLKDVNRLLKFDPKNTELLSQKQKNLKNAIEATKKRLETLREAQSKVAKGSDEWDRLQREISDTESKLKGLQREYRAFGSVAKQVVKATGEQIQKLGKKIEDAGKKFQPLSRAATGFLTSMGALGYKAATTGDDLNTLAKQTGLTTAEIQKMQYASDLVDVSLDDITSAMAKMKKGMSGNTDAFDALGVSVTDADGNLRSATDVFYNTLFALSKIDNETERDIKAMEIFGKGADELAGIIDDGGTALRLYGKEAEDLGLILDQDTVDALSKTSDAIARIKGSLKGSALKLGAKIAEAAVPVVEKLSGLLEKVSGWLDNLTPQQTEMALKIAAIIAVIAPLLILIGKIAIGVGGLITAFSFLLSPVGLVIAAIVALVAIGVALYKNWDKIKAKAEELKNNVVAAWQQMKANVAAKIDQIKNEAVAKWENLKSAVITTVNNIKTNVLNKWDELKSNVAAKIEELKNGAIDKFNALKSSLSDIIEKIKALFNFQWELPHLKLPHISISYEDADSAVAKFFGVSRIPHLSVQWYKKAMENPVLFTSPTVLQTPNGLKGFGDGGGAEIVMGLEKLQELVGANKNVTVNVVLQGDAKGMFKVLTRQNNIMTRATNYNAFSGA